MGTRVRQEKKGKTQRGTREGKNRFFRNGIDHFERTSKRCESLITIFFLVFFFFISIYETDSQRDFKKYKAGSKVAREFPEFS